MRAWFESLMCRWAHSWAFDTYRKQPMGSLHYWCGACDCERRIP